MIKRLLGEQTGSALIASIILLSCMLGTGFALASIVDTQTQVSVKDRQRETAFTLAEAAMNAQVFSLARDWPGKGQAVTPYPACTPATGGARCPNPTALAAHTASPDAVGATWSTRVVDNGPALAEQYFSDAAASGQPAYDANGDGQLWVRAEATAKGHTRKMVALVRAEEHEEDVPHGALVTGRLDISNMGKKVIIDASAGGSAQSGLVAVRCTPASGETSSCAGHPIGGGAIRTPADLSSLLTSQISPNVLTTGYTGGAALTPDARLRLRARAIADGTWFSSCPPEAQLSGAVVYIESGACSYTGNTQFNSPAKPGLVILGNGSLYLGGTSVFYGVINAANLAGSQGALVQIQGNAEVHGGVLVDGAATTIAGSSKLNIQLDLNAYREVASYGSAGVIQNTWRELR